MRAVTTIGKQFYSGTYILRVRLYEPKALSFGRFKKGKIISLDAGEYSYVGSAMGIKGPLCLPRRLVRHATRCANEPPHAIRTQMIAELLERGLGQGNLLLRGPKRFGWNIDHLTNLKSAELISTIAIRSDIRFEKEIGRFLMADPATVIFEPGLGANDIPGNTHLLRVDAGNDWWEHLARRLRRLIKTMQG